VVFEHGLTDHQVVGFVASGPGKARIQHRHRKKEATDPYHQRRKMSISTNGPKKVIACSGDRHRQDYIESATTDPSLPSAQGEGVVAKM
jgi:hypothetical protein